MKYSSGTSVQAFMTAWDKQARAYGCDELSPLQLFSCLVNSLPEDLRYMLETLSRFEEFDVNTREGFQAAKAVIYMALLSDFNNRPTTVSVPRSSFQQRPRPFQRQNFNNRSSDYQQPFQRRHHLYQKT